MKEQTGIIRIHNQTSEMTLILLWTINSAQRKFSLRLNFVYKKKNNSLFRVLNTNLLMSFGWFKLISVLLYKFLIKISYCDACGYLKLTNINTGSRRGMSRKVCCIESMNNNKENSLEHGLRAGEDKHHGPGRPNRVGLSRSKA